MVLLEKGVSTATPPMTGIAADDEGLFLVRVLRHIHLHQDDVWPAHLFLPRMLLFLRALFYPLSIPKVASFWLL